MSAASRYDSLVRKEVEELFDALSAQPPKVRLCSRCGAHMVFLDSVIVLQEGDRGWKIPIPVCPKCETDLEKFEIFPRRGAA